ncbi:MAG: hypothetical protein HZA37_01625 [Parcubacteria group bacterium]|nr:hypothetical protein [Parcubacteria group bacterium]
MNKYPIIRKIYLYLFALVGLSLVTIGGVRLVGLGLKTYVFTKADIYYEYPTTRPTMLPMLDGKEIEAKQPTKEEVEEYQNKQQTANRQREAAEALAFIIVGLPLYLYHWSVIKKDKKEELENA